MRWLAWCAMACVLHVAGAAAAPQVEIKAQTQLQLGTVKLRGDGTVAITGQLLDRLTNEGISSQPVLVRYGGRDKRAYTDADGRFEAVLPAVPGPQPVGLEFGGNASIDRAAPVTIVTDPARAQVELTIRTTVLPTGISVGITSTVDGADAVLPVQLAVGDAADTELRPYRVVDTDRPIVLPRAELGGPGTRRLRATFAGDATRQPAVAETTLELVATTTTTLKLRATSLAYEDDLVATGTVTDDDGKPVARAAVTLTAGDRRLAQGATAADGTYRFEIEAEILGAGQFGLFVQSDAGSPYLRASKSDPAIVRIAAPQPVPVSYTIAAFLATALAAGGFFAARSKPWRRLRRAAARADAPQPAGSADLEGGLVIAKPGLVSTLRRAADDGFAGVVRDTVRGRPIPGAGVRLVLGDRSHEMVAGADGAFGFEQLAAGEWQAEVEAPGHVRERFAVTIPHRGELRGVRVDLIPVRERVFQLYRRAAEPQLPEARLWGIWSPRQIVDHVRSRRPSPALAELTDFVEEVYFSARIAGEAVLPDAEGRVDRAIRERTERAS